MCSFIFYHSAGSFFLTLRIIWGRVVLLLSGKAVFLPIRINFKRIDLAILKLTLSCLKNIVEWRKYLFYQDSLLILLSPTSLSASVALTVTGVGPPQYLQPGEGAGSRSPASKDPKLLGENVF